LAFKKIDDDSCKREGDGVTRPGRSEKRPRGKHGIQNGEVGGPQKGGGNIEVKYFKTRVGGGMPQGMGENGDYLCPRAVKTDLNEERTQGGMQEKPEKKRLKKKLRLSVLEKETYLPVKKEKTGEEAKKSLPTLEKKRKKDLLNKSK